MGKFEPMHEQSAVERRAHRQCNLSHHGQTRSPHCSSSCRSSSPPLRSRNPLTSTPGSRGRCETFEVPGISLAVVKDDRVVVAKGYGVRRLGEPAPVDARTLFGIASNTKAFTATALGLLVEEDKIEWDAPVVRYLPAFAMSDPYVTRELTVRDLLVHRSGLGLGAGDLLWWPRVDLRPQGDCAATPLHSAGDELPQRVRVRQRALSGRRRADRVGERADAGRISSRRGSSRRSA